MGQMDRVSTLAHDRPREAGLTPRAATLDWAKRLECLPPESPDASFAASRRKAIGTRSWVTNWTPIFESLPPEATDLADVAPLAATFGERKLLTCFRCTRNRTQEADGSIPFSSTKLLACCPVSRSLLHARWAGRLRPITVVAQDGTTSSSPMGRCNCRAANEVYLHVPGLRLLPIRKHPDRLLPALPSARVSRSGLCEHAIDGRGADRQHTRADGRVEVKVAMSFH